jgi:subtilisin family serine protease/PKD repeat protein
MRRIFIMVVILSLALTSVGLAAELLEKSSEPPGDVILPKFVPNKIVVRFDPQTVAAMNRETARRGQLGIPALDHLGGRLGVASVTAQFPKHKGKRMHGKVFDLSGWHVVKFAGKADVQEAVMAYKALPGVIEAHPVSFLKAYKNPAEQYDNVQWYLSQIEAYRAWDIQTGNPAIVIAILDSGVRYFAADMAGGDPNPSGTPNPLYAPEPYSVDNWPAINGNIWINAAERGGQSGVDEDNNGYVDDWVGWDFVDGNTSGLPELAGEDYNGSDNDPRDFNGHGTQCASIAGAITNNNEAGAGVAGGWWPTPGVKIMPLRVAYSVLYGGFSEVAVGDTALAASALVYAADHGARIASFSYGATENDHSMDAALEYFLTGGGLFIVAAGNSASNEAPYPQSYPHPNVIVVGGTDQYDAPWYDFFSGGTNYGDWVKISAPAVDICTLTHLNSDPGTDYFLSPYFSAVAGTSFAAPMVAGVAALMWSQNPQLAADQIRSILLDPANCDPIKDNGFLFPPKDQMGVGRVNAYKAVSAVPTTVNQPPTACFTFTTAGLSATFSSSCSSDPDGTIASYSWDFGDGATSSTANPSHSYAAAGTYTVALTVTDNKGATGTISRPVTVSAQGNALHVGDLDGKASVKKTSWVAVVTVQVHDTSEKVIAGATVTGEWSDGASGTSTAVTDRRGACKVSSTSMSKSTPSATFTVTGVSKSGYGYDSNANHDPDGDSNGTSITVSK